MISRRRLLRWAHWFTAAHAGLLGLIGLRYLWLYMRLSPTVAWVYAPLGYIGHIAVLAYLPILLLVVPSSCCSRGRAWWCPWAWCWPARWPVS